ncbi:hypothetical protein [Erythrobacter ani]|uniref:Lipoprotein n=1 Tax=Erythrobacter ani TaxID=2827235 RepID=A0ABS6SRA4_9SPHN|nr:hypothetical protein [Erythrobacter ani]MBV7267174.1 hypothetical protein [Erythrobacter ani]
MAFAYLPALLAACSDDRAADTIEPAGAASTASVSEADPIVDMLVDRFDVPACANALPAGLMRKEGPDGREVVRTFTAEAPCLDSLVKALAALDFQEAGPGSFTRHGERNSLETVTIERAEDQRRGGIQWEEINP